ncbi:phospholysine phosphohistidine inorganic pyrophosphate phosphatase-like [Paramacrobiotus metropolitanus]|uniref:phospholysine phosphohistidine inorganic pyrophosphate phosphatase-like n=1 Tax=Paramacrobiotus metropolitanus TaxID=2943436 RepID=UPI0024455F6B|nr:phospholysine phosphohistidine inorganic pyrophosphate phosphatase-like [Paramacrobiotus metropolitanus]
MHIDMSKKWLEGKGFLLDITGVLYDSCGATGTAIPGSIEALQLLRQHHVPFRFITNESTSDRQHLAVKLNTLGFEIGAEEIIAPAPQVVKILRERGLRPFLLVKDTVLPEFAGLNTMNPNCVVMGDAQDNFSYENINRAFSVLINLAQPVLISMGCGRYYKETDGLKMDVGAYCKGLEYACGIQAEYCGKPDPRFFQAALDSLGLESDTVVMVGDDVRNDVNGAQKAGMMGVLVQTGKYRTGDEGRGEKRPDAVMGNLLGVVRAYLDAAK